MRWELNNQNWVKKVFIRTKISLQKKTKKQKDNSIQLIFSLIGISSEILKNKIHPFSKISVTDFA